MGNVSPEFLRRRVLSLDHRGQEAYLRASRRRNLQDARVVALESLMECVRPAATAEAAAILARVDQLDAQLRALEAEDAEARTP